MNGSRAIVRLNKIIIRSLQNGEILKEKLLNKPLLPPKKNNGLTIHIYARIKNVKTIRFSSVL